VTDPPQGRRVTMRRPDLAGIPQFTLPEPFALRRYRPRDEEHWLAMHRVGDTLGRFTPRTFVEQFGTDAEVLALRQYYLCDAAAAPIGTATAWYDDAETGRVHWVVIAPEYRGRGLAKPMLAAVCNRMRQLGHTRARLGTNTLRLPAIGLYLKFGFRPEINGPDDTEAWRGVRARLGAGPLAEMELSAG